MVEGKGSSLFKKLVLGVSSLAALGGAHEVGKSSGHASGYEAGEKAGKAVGAEEGKNIGFKQGEEAGKKAGFAEGEAKGKEEGRVTAQEGVARAAETKTEKADGEDKEAKEFSENQEKLRDELESLRIDKNEEKRFKASKDAAEIADKAFGFKVKETLESYDDWLRTENTKEVDGSADIIITMTQTESGLNLVREKVRTDKGFKAAVENVFNRMSNLRDKVASSGRDLEEKDYLFIADKDNSSNLDVTYDDDYEKVISATETVEKINKATGETETEEREVGKKEVERRDKIQEREQKRQSEWVQSKINVLAKVLAEKAPEAK